MQQIIQKLHTLVVPLLILVGVSPILVSGSAVAAARGTCILKGNQGAAAQQVASCSSFFPSGKDANGTKVDSTKCYELSEARGSVSISKAVSCSNGELNNVVATCPDGTPAPSTGCTASHGNIPPDGGGDCANGVAHCDLVTKYLQPLIKLLSAFVGLAVVISIIIGGIQYASSADDPQKVSAAKNRIRNAIVALVTFIFLYALLNFLIPGGLL